MRAAFCFEGDRKAFQEEVLSKGNYETQLRRIVKSATRSHQGVIDAGIEGDIFAEGGKLPYDELLDALEWATARVTELKYHMHDWNADDYCNVCGVDGRA